ncbi:hypothetical protein PROFUN_13072 [Planoprotostelium fungivorum]|uniref:CAP-Gly domain-containing protein n=1 Tax=Planoprotostelium fungivorum TaxID=1890364 RepID=A0A2P6N5H1_9EUKA|nr:hypothetical protein PROFUN_13072 [Planoprotostelium fungivorum]
MSALEGEPEIGSRVQIIGKAALGDGIVKFYGPTQFQTGNWVGLELDAPNGKNDGSVQDVRYFSAKENHGLFIRPNQLTLIAPASAVKVLEKSSSIEKSAPTEKPEKVEKVAEKPEKVEKVEKIEKTEKAEKAEKPEKTAEKSTGVKTATPTSRRVGTTTATKTSTPSSVKSSRLTSTLTPSSTTKRTTAKEGETASTPLKTTRTVTTVKKPISSTPSTTEKKTITKSSSVLSQSSVGEKEEEEKDTASTNVSATPSAATSDAEDEEEVPIVSPKIAAPTPNLTLGIPSPNIGDPISPIGSAPPSAPSTPRTAVPKEEPFSSAAPTPATPAPAPAPAPAPSPAASIALANQEKLIRALRDANEWKMKAEDTIRSLSTRLKENAGQTEKLARELLSSRENFEKEKEKSKRDSERELAKLQKQFEKEKEELEEQLAQVTESVEEMTLDREIAEEKAEALEEELEGLKAKLSLAEIENSSKSSAPEGEEITASSKELQEQNDKLKEALMKLRDLSVEEKKDREKRIKELEKENKSIPGLQEKVLKLEVDLEERTNEVEELKEAMDAAADSEAIIEELSDKKMNLEEKVAELQATIEELEEMRDISQEIEENQAAVEKQLRSEIYGKEVELLDAAGQSTNLSRKISELERTIQQFRILVKGQQDEINQLRQRENESISQSNELEQQSRSLMTLTHHLQNQAVKANAIGIDMAMSDINMQQSSLQLAFVLGDAFSKDYHAFSMLMLMKRLNSKARVVEQNSPDSNEDDDATLWISEFRYLLSEVQRISSDVVYVLSQCDPDNFLRIGLQYLEMAPMEKRMDDLISSAKEETISDASVLPLRELHVRLSGLYEAHIDRESVSLARRLTREVSFIQIYIERALIGEGRLVRAIQKATDALQPAEIMPITLFPKKRLQYNVELCRKLERTLAEYEPAEEGREQSVQIVTSSLENSQKILQCMDKVCDEFLPQLSSLRGSPEEISAALSSYLQSSGMDNWSTLEGHVEPVYNQLTELTNILSLGSLAPKIEGEVVPAQAQRMKVIQEELHNSALMKNKLNEKTGETNEFKRLLQLRDVELQDIKWKEQALEKKIQRLLKTEEKLNSRIAEDSEKAKSQEKMYTEAVDTLQKDQNLTAGENKTLREKITQLSKQMAEKEQNAADLPAGLVTEQITEMRLAIRHLSHENSILRGRENSKLLEISLPPLQKFGTQTETQSTSKFMNNDVASGLRQMQSLQREMLMRNACTTVVDLNHKTSPAEAQLRQIKLEKEYLQDKLNAIRQKFGGHMMSSGAKRGAEEKKEGGALLLGKMTLKGCVGELSREKKVIVDHKQFERLVSLVTDIVDTLHDSDIVSAAIFTIGWWEAAPESMEASDTSLCTPHEPQSFADVAQMITEMNRPTSRSLFIFAVILHCLLFYAYLAYRYRDVRYSLFYQHDEEAHNAENVRQKRMQMRKAKQEFDEMFTAVYSNDTTTEMKFTVKDLCVGIVSVNRRPQRYLLETVASLINHIDAEVADRVTLFVLNTMPNEDDHPDACDLKHILPVIHRSTIYPQSYAHVSGWHGKEVIDYVFALKICHKLSRAIDPLERGRSTTQRGLFDEPWMFVRLFYSEYFLGWSVEDAISLIIMSLIIGSIITPLLLFLYSLHGVSSTAPAMFTDIIWIEGERPVSFVKNQTQFSLCLWIFMTIISCSTLLSVGKQNLFHAFETGLYPYASHALTTGMLYSNNRTEALSQYLLDHHQEQPVDILIGQYAEERGLQRLLLVPNIVQHIGAFSSNRNKKQSFDDHKDSLTFEE